MPYDPSQPREPRGSDIGGQWTSVGGKSALLEQLELTEAVEYDPDTGDVTYDPDRVTNKVEQWMHKGKYPDSNVRAILKDQVVEELHKALRDSTLSDAELLQFAEVFMKRETWPKSYRLQGERDLRVGAARVAAEGLVNQWADSSGDGEARSIALQYAAQGLVATRDAPYVPASWEPGPQAAGFTIYEKNRAAFGVATKHIYDSTQAALKKAGIETVEVYRGLGVNEADFPALGEVYAGPVRLQPLSSFSSKVSDAHVFATAGADIVSSDIGKQGVPVVMAVRVPRDQVFSTPKTGIGCLSESECVLLGSRPTSAIYAGIPRLEPGESQTEEYDARYPASRWFPELVGEARLRQIRGGRGLRGARTS
jgi:hypothetical protein